MTSPSLLIVLSGPSGAGKGTVCKALLEQYPNLHYSISATTRKPRPGEIHGVHYYFLEESEFLQKRDAGHFLEWAQVYDNYYGTPKQAVEEQLNSGKDVILEIDIQGALQVKKQFPQGVFIFIVPPSLGELEKRIMKRGTESRDVIQKRLSSVVNEMSYISEYDYVVINDRVEKAVEKLKAIITAEKCRPFRRQVKLE